MVGGIDPTPRRSPTSVDMGGIADQEMCIPIPRQIDISIAVGVQQTWDRPVAACTRYSGDNLDIEAIHPSQQKITKRQQTGNKPVAAGSRHMDFDPRVETDLYLK